MWGEGSPLLMVLLKVYVLCGIAAFPFSRETVDGEVQNLVPLGPAFKNWQDGDSLSCASRFGKSVGLDCT